MTDQRKLVDFRQWVLAVLDLLGAAPARQVEYLHVSGVGADEILLQFDDLLHVARARLGDGSLKQEDYLLLEEINDRVDAVNSRPESIWTEDALGEAAEWNELRVAAKMAKSELERSWN